MEERIEGKERVEGQMGEREIENGRPKESEMKLTVQSYCNLSIQRQIGVLEAKNREEKRGKREKEHIRSMMLHSISLVQSKHA